jgi:hypothetical protein
MDTEELNVVTIPPGHLGMCTKHNTRHKGTKEQSVAACTTSARPVGTDRPHLPCMKLSHLVVLEHTCGQKVRALCLHGLFVRGHNAACIEERCCVCLSSVASASASASTTRLLRVYSILSLLSTVLCLWCLVLLAPLRSAHCLQPRLETDPDTDNEIYADAGTETDSN